MKLLVATNDTSSTEKNTKKKSNLSEAKPKSIFDRMIPVAPAPDRPASYYLKPRQVGVKIKTTGAKVQSEDEVVKQCVEYLRKNGWVTKTLFTGGIPTAAGRFVTNPAKGQPDSIIFHLGKKICLYIEYKKSHGGILSPEQKDWHNLLRHCGHTVWVVNSLKCLKEYLETLETKEDRVAS